MHASTLNSIVLALCLGTTASAQIAPSPDAANPAAAAGGNVAAATAEPTCSQAMILAQGIALNIMDQQQELATANQLMTILSANPVDTAAYGAARTNLLKFVNNGIAIREMNQLITPANNKATAGVATVANAQLTELGLSTNLTIAGSDDVAGNMNIVKMLQMNFAGGIQQNMKNMADAMAGCGGSIIATAPAPAPAAAAAAAPAPAAAQGAINSTAAEAPKAAAVGNETTTPGATEENPKRSMTDHYRIGAVSERPSFLNSRRGRIFAA